MAGFGPYNGYVPQAGHELNPLVENGPILSASGLETAGCCPLRFFFRNGLKLYPPEEMEVDEDRWLNAAHFGQLLHEVFRQFMRELCGGSGRPQFERDHTRLAEVLHRVVGQWRKDIPPPNESAYRMQFWQLVRTSRIFLQVEETFCRTSQPRFLEVALGLEGIAGGSPLDEAEPTTIRLPNGRSILAKGQIDRVDEAGPNRYGVWDYKTGSGHGYAKSDPFRQGRRVQSVLYLRMVETALRKEVDAQAVVERFGYFFPTIRANGLRVDWDADTLAAGLGVVERICASIENGAFLATDNKEDCQWCDYRPICGDVNQVVAQSKALLDQGDLVSLRPLRELRRV